MRVHPRVANHAAQEPHTNAETSTAVTPNPGSDEAVALGCSCPVLDNGRGRGIGAGAFFWINADCPLHCGSAETSTA